MDAYTLSPLAPTVGYENYIWPINSTITIGDEQYASLWGLADIMQQRFKQLASDSFKGDSGGKGGNNRTGIMVSAGFNWNTKLLGIGLVVKGAVGSQFAPNISAVVSDVPIELDASLAIQVKAAVAINVSLAVDFTDGVTSPKASITVNQFNVTAVHHDT